MKAVLQRVVSGSVSVDGAVISSIGRGIVALVGIHRDDTKADLDYIVRKLVSVLCAHVLCITGYDTGQPQALGR